MSDPSNPLENRGVFYSHPERNGKADKSRVVDDIFLFVDGSPVKDPHFAAKGADTSDRTFLYSRLKADGTIDETSKFDNSGNYLVVNKDFNLADDEGFAAKINGLKGFRAKIQAMKKAFRDFGSEDLQRSASHGVPAGEVNPAVKDAASWNFGYITEQVDIPNILAKMKAGELNISEYIHNKQHKFPSLHYGMNLADAENMDAGIEAAKKAIGFHKLLLPISASRFISVAPTRPARQSAKPKPAAFQRSEHESFHASLRQMAKVSAAIGISQEIKNFVKALIPGRSGVSHEIAQAITGARAQQRSDLSVASRR